MKRNESAPSRRPSKPYGRLGRCLRSVDELIREHGRRGADEHKRASPGTVAQRRQDIKYLVKRLHAKGYPIVDIHHLKPKHFPALAKDMADRGLAAATLQKHFTHLARVCVWIGKPGMVGDPRRYFDDPAVFERTYAAEIPETLPVPRIDVETVIAEATGACPRVGTQLELCHEFGMRVIEALRYRPREREATNEPDICFKGAKNRRYRSVPIETDAQRDLLERAKALAPFKSASLIPIDYDLARWKHRFRYVMRRIGLTSEGLGATPHSLRHFYARRTYQRLTGQPCPADGGTGEGLSRVEDREARLIIAERLGHGRESVTCAYLGPILTGRRR